MATSSRKRVSKKNKSAWRKHVNIDDIENFLEDKRLEERLGDPLSTLKNEELFSIDTGSNIKEQTLPLKVRKRLKLLDPKSFSALKPTSKIPDPIKKRNRVRTKEERENPLVKAKRQKILKQKQIQSVKDYEIYKAKKKSKPKKGQFDKDIWNEEENFEINSDPWANDTTKKHNLAGIGKLRKSIQSPAVKKTSILPSVEAPHPGMSYNPSFKDHQDLVKDIATKEMEIIKKEEHLHRVTKGMFSKVTEDQRDSAWLEEMSQGLLSKGEKQNESEPSDNEYSTVNPPVKNKKKTLKQRRKQKEQMKFELERKSKKIEKKKVTDLHRLQVLDKIIKKKETKSDKLRELRRKKRELKKKEAKRLGSLKFEEPDLEFNFSHDIAGNLRNMKKEGNLLLDRFKSLQKRNILEPTKRRLPKRGKVKVFTKPGHKDDEWKKTVAK